MINPRCTPPRMLLLLVLVAFVCLCDATGIRFTNSDFDVRAGEKFRLTWTDQSDAGTIKLMSGSPDGSNLQFRRTVIANTRDPQYDWLVPSDLPLDDNYFLQLFDTSGSEYYSSAFHIKAPIAGTTSFITTAPPTSKSDQPSSTGASSLPDSSPPPSQGLSTAALAGIGISVAIVIIFMIGGVGYFFYNRGKAVGAKGAQIRDDDWQNDAQYYKEKTARPTSIYEMDANPEPTEMGVREQCTVEMPAPVQVMELESPRFGGDGKGGFGGLGRESLVSPVSPGEGGGKGLGKTDLEGQYKR